MLHRLMHFPLVFLTFFVLSLASGDGSFTTSAAPQAAPVKHGLTGSYYVGTGGWTKDTPPVTGGFRQIWSDPNDFMLPRTFTAPAATRVDAQIAFGQGKGFNARSGGPPTIWWPTGFPSPPGWGPVAPTDKPWDQLAAVIWKGYIHLPKAGTYYLGTISNGASAVYVNQARVALNGVFGGVLATDSFNYAKEDVQDYVEKLNPAYKFAARPGDTYVVPVAIDAPRDLPIEVHYNPSQHFTHWASDPFGIDLLWVTPGCPRDSNGKPIANIVPGDALYTEAPGPIEKPTVRSANSTISADHLYFPTQYVDESVTLTVRLADKDGNPVPGKRVYVSSLNEWNPDAIVQPDRPTDKNGETTAKIRANAANPYAHDSTIFATDMSDFVDVEQLAHVTFQQVDWNFFTDAFSPYYDRRFSITPRPPVVGRPATIKTELKNHSKFPATVTVTFLTTDSNIGFTNWDEIAKVKDLTLQPGESKEVSTTFTPKEVMGHKCYKLEVEGRYIATNSPGGGVLTASLVPGTIVQAAALANPPDQPAKDKTQINTETVDCQPDEGKRCQDIGKAVATIAAARQPAGSAALYQALQQNLGAQLNQIRPELCDNPAAQSKLDQIRKDLSSLNYVDAASNLQNNLALVRIQDGLMQLEQMVCHVAPPSQNGVCPGGEKEATPGDEEAAKFIKEKFKEAYEKVSETARELQDHGATVPQQLSDQMKNLKKAIAFWDQIKAGSCVPPDVLQTMQQVMRDRQGAGYSENCAPMCSALRSWFEKLIGQPGSLQGKLFMDDCLARCS